MEENTNDSVSGVMDTEVNGKTEKKKSSQKLDNTKNRTIIDSCISIIADEIGKMSRGKPQDVTNGVTDILVTIAQINFSEWNAVGLRVDGCLYRFDEYQATQGLCALICPARIVLEDTSSAVDFNDRIRFKTTIGKTLTPGEFVATQRMVASKLRVNVSYHPVSRQSVGLLTSENHYAVKGGKVVTDRNQERLVFLKTRFDEDPGTDIQDWCRTVAGKLFEYERS